MFTTTAAAAHIAASYATPQSADFNHDGQVNVVDLEQWQQSFGTNGLADANGDGLSDGADFLAWQHQFSDEPTSLTVPEPTPLTLAALASLFLCLRPRRIAC
jgi:hypothetical protein